MILCGVFTERHITSHGSGWPRCHRRNPGLTNSEAVQVNRVESESVERSTSFLINGVENHRATLQNGNMWSLLYTDGVRTFSEDFRRVVLPERGAEVGR